jgi:hypothetical protein
LKKRAAHLINTLLQQGVAERTKQENRFNGLLRVWKAVKTALALVAPRLTPLKWGVNEKSNPITGKVGEKCRLRLPHPKFVVPGLPGKGEFRILPAPISA